MKYAAFSIVYNEEALMQGCIDTWKGRVDKHIVMMSVKPFHGECYPPDRSYSICRNNNVPAIQRHWKQEHEMRNSAVALLQDYDYIFVSDADMWLTADDVSKLKEEIEKTKQDAYVIPQKSYWFDTSHTLECDDFMPVIAIRPSVRFHSVGCVDRNCHIISSAICHHLNWCAPKDILKKVKTYAHASEMENVEIWYNTHYKNWTEGQPAVMPIHNGVQKQFNVCKYILPKELQESLCL